MQECDFVREQLRSYQMEEAGVSDESSLKDEPMGEKEKEDEEKEDEEEQKKEEEGESEGSESSEIKGEKENVQAEEEEERKVEAGRKAREEKYIKHLESLITEYRDQLHSLTEESPSFPPTSQSVAVDQVDKDETGPEHRIASLERGKWFFVH